MSAQDTTQVRETAKSIVQRAINDVDFAERLRSDPRPTLLEAGLPEQYVDDFIAYDLGIEADVAGYAPPECNGVTCIFFTCGETFA